MENLFIYLFYFLIFILGASLASFICASYFRKNNNESKKVKSKKSFCDSCEKTLSWYQLLPVFSFAAYLGKCKNCKIPIKKEYFICEILLGVFALSLFAFLQNNLIILINENLNLFINILITFTFSFLFGTLTYQDYKEKMVESVYLYLFILLTIIFNYFTNFSLYTLLFLVFSFVLAFIFAKKEIYFGFADLFSIISLFLFFGLSFGINIFLYSVWIGAIFSIIFMFIKYKKYVKKLEMPFLPFLFFGILTFLLLYNIFNFYIIDISYILELWQFIMI